MLRQVCQTDILGGSNSTAQTKVQIRNAYLAN